MSKDKKKKRSKKKHKTSNDTKWQLSPASWQFQSALDWAMHPAVTLEFEYSGTRYRGTAYPVKDAV